MRLSIASSPANTSITSVFGLAYLLVKTAHRKAVKFLDRQPDFCNDFHHSPLAHSHSVEESLNLTRR